MKQTYVPILVCLLAGASVLYCQAPAKKTGAPAASVAKGDAAKGKGVFETQCSLCHEATTADQKMGPSLKGLFKRPTMATTKKPTNDANVMGKIDEGGNGMPPFADMISAGEKADLLAYLKSL